MTKLEFFKYCATSKGRLSVTWGRIYREAEKAVFLNGIWARQAILDIQLYRPIPGRQHRDMYKTANRLCEKQCSKFSRWLEEWKVLQSPSSP